MQHCIQTTGIVRLFTNLYDQNTELEYSAQVAQWRDYLEQARQAGYFCTVGTPRASCFHLLESVGGQAGREARKKP